MALKSKKETIITVDYGDIDAFIAEKYPFLKGYEIQQGEEWGNDSQHRFIVSGKIMDYDREDWEEIKNSKDAKEMRKNTEYRAELILNMLVADGHLEAGKYIIDVCW